MMTRSKTFKTKKHFQKIVCIFDNEQKPNHIDTLKKGNEQKSNMVDTKKFGNE